MAETATYVVDPAALERGVAMLEPAEAAQMYQHPDLNAWRTILEQLSDEKPGSLPCSSRRSMRP